MLLLTRSGRVLGVFLCTLCLCSARGEDPTSVQVNEPNGVVRYSEPILSADKSLGESRVFNPTVIVVGQKLAMIYRADLKGAVGGALGLAFSDDGRSFTRYASNPVMVADSASDKAGCEDPHLVRFDRTYYLTYVGNTGGGHLAQCLATSTDLMHWQKKGAVLKAEGWDAGQVKAGVIVPEKVGGKYIMYFAGQTQAWQPSIGMAVSEDFLHWTQPLDHPLFSARADHFDSLGVEPGATPIVLPEGILLIYNGWNPAHVHKTGWVLFAKDDPSRVIKRCEEAFIEPQFKYEIDGRHVFTFTEGAAFFKGLWRFYYGAADKSIGLAEVSDIHTLSKGGH